jgi:lipopolysaccharide export system protein LptA
VSGRAAPGRRWTAVLLAAACVLAVSGAHAERADREKETDVTADHSTFDDLHQVNILTGHVILTKGTMRLTGERMEHHQDERGYQYYVVIAAPGELATFHERRDPTQPGIESTVDGIGERIEYDDKSDQVVLIRRALVKKFDNGEQREVLSGARIVYDGRKDSYEVEGRGSDGTGGRVYVVIPPRVNPDAPAAAPPAAAPPAAAPAPGGKPAAPPAAVPLLPELRTDRQPPEDKP